MDKKKNDEEFYFEISLSVLNHLGRKLYRSFITVLGEAISNSWDAEAKNVYIYIDRNKNLMYIKDDGSGMTANDFQKNFLKIGYSKRRKGSYSENRHRPYIGRKGIGKLALLSCAERITVISKTSKGDYIGGTIDNSGLDKAITDDLTPKEYPLLDFDIKLFGDYIRNHKKGTIIYFDKINEGIKHSPSFLEKIIALSFRFSLIDNEFNIHLNDNEITVNALKDLINKTEFLWIINDINDPYIDALKKKINASDRNEYNKLDVNTNFKGFIASVEKPRYLKITNTEERVGVDLFVNGRLREKDILKHMPTARVVESYIYGQIHCDDLDDKEDRFTSSRESIVADDPKFRNLLDSLRKKIINPIMEDWDALRRKNRKDGDPDNTRISKKERKAEELFNAVSEDYDIPKDGKSKVKVNNWVSELSDDAKFNFTSYADCFISENLIRKYIYDKNIKLSTEAEDQINDKIKKEKNAKNRANISIILRRKKSKLSYLSMDGLANLVDKSDQIKNASLSRDAREYKPMRDALAHTALLTDEAKQRLNSVYENIKARIRELMEEINR